MDGGTSLNGTTWYQVGQNSTAPSTGLPLGTSFTVGDPTTGADTFQFQGTGANNTVLLAGDGDGPTTATFTLSQPAVYNTFSFLAANGNGSGNVSLTFNYVGGGTYSTTLNIGDWFNDGSNTAYNANGRISSGGYDQVGNNNPRLYYYDLTGVPSTQQIQSISLSFAGGGSTHTAIMGVSGFLASAINWSAAQNISAASDVETAGVLAYAYAENSGTTTVNGVAFTGLNGAYQSNEASPNMTTTGFNGNYNGYGGGPASYNGLLSGAIYYDVSSGSGIGSVNINNLTAGHQYLVQYWVNDSRNGTGGNGRAVTLSSPGGNSATLTYDVSGVGYGQYATGVLTAAGSTATVVVNGNSVDVQMNALQVRDVTNIGYWSGTAGTAWDANTTANFGTNAYSAPAAFGTFAQATSATQNAYFGDYYYNSGGTVAVGTSSVRIAAGGVSTGTVNFINNAANYTVTSPDSNGIGGSTAVNISGGGLVTLVGSHSYTGTTTISAGTLQLGTGASGQDGSIANTSTVTDNSALVYNLAGTQSAAYPITGYGSLTMAGTGTQVLGSLSNPTAASGNMFTGNITINGGTLIGAAASNGNNGPFGAGSNTRTITINAGGTLQFDAPNTFAAGFFGATNVPTLNIDGGVVTNGDPAATGKVNNALNNVNLDGGTLTATTGQHPNGYAAGYGAWNINGAITSSGNSVIATTDPVYGTTMLTNNAAANGVTTFNVQNGTLLVSAPLSEDITDGEVSGLNQTGAGTMVLTATNTYTGNTTVSGGTLQLGDGIAKNGSVVANIVNNSTVVFANPAAQLFNGMVSGGGNLVKTAPGTLTIAAQQTYTGPTLISAGTVKLSPAAQIPGFGPDTVGSNGSNPIWTTNTNNVGATAITNNVLTLTDGNQSEARTAFFNTPVPVTAPFTVNFVYQGLGAADGSAFVLQNDSRGLSAIGDTGGALAYTGANPIVNSVGVGFDIYNNGLYFLSNGSLGSLQSSGGVNINSQDPIAVTLSYDGSSNLAITLVDQENNASYMTTDALGASIASIVGSNAAYLGFTGASGGFGATQTIGNFSTSLSYSASNILPSGTALTLAGGGKLDLNGASQQVATLDGAGEITNSGGSLAAFTVAGPGATTFDGTIADGAGKVALAVIGGSLTLSGTGTYTGGTYVEGTGSLIVTTPEAIGANGVVTNLFVGSASELSLLGGVTAAEAGSSAGGTTTAVPEPGTLVLLAACGAAAAMLAGRRPRGYGADLQPPKAVRQPQRRGACRRFELARRQRLVVFARAFARSVAQHNAQRPNKGIYRFRFKRIPASAAAAASNASVPGSGTAAVAGPAAPASATGAKKVPAVTIKLLPLASAVSSPITSVAWPVTTVPPVKVFVPLRMSRPLPDTSRAILPAPLAIVPLKVLVPGIWSTFKVARDEKLLVTTPAAPLKPVTAGL